MLLILILFIGLSLLLYPTFADWWNSSRSSSAIVTYSEEVRNLERENRLSMWNEAREYNQTLLNRTNNFRLSEDKRTEYYQTLNLTETGIMGYIEIPAVKVTLPIYHGTEEKVLQVAVGHLEWSSLPVGGASTHCVLSGHRGLPSARLFTDLDKLVEGDLFLIRVLDEVLTYEVDRIEIVKPHQMNALLIEKGEDLCTLVTCTPYGINTHRLLVRGHRIENIEESHAVRATADALLIDPLIVAPVVAAPILLVLLILLLLPMEIKLLRGINEDELL